ncbi:hypothetical protein [Flammeovirga agarivorans]|uniref:Kelch motif-containing protein n=1 Tax=Flammeovirga agarivorans TaxID=2726742 RepID=A0A7X8SNP3_9BACT|nr:hypothetical protein [Flammeovirga agarivorans]NLR93503.1 hypothetical protein [Flammeovirga agarivorans]
MKYFLITTISILLVTFNLFAQYKGGIKFKSHDHDLESRTSLILLEGAKVNAEERMVLTTDILFNKTRKHYFGYILRMIDSSHRNIDIVYNYNNPDNYNFSLIYDHDITPIQFNFEDQESALNEWTTLVLEVDITNNQLTLSIGDQSKTLTLPEIQKFTNLKYYFGANNNPYFKVHDVAPVTLRNIEIQLDDLQLQWPLNEKAGTVVNCNQGEAYNGIVNNGIWLHEVQSKWEKIGSRRIDGSLFYFDEENSDYYFMNNDTLYRKGMYQEKAEYILTGNYPFFNDPNIRVVESQKDEVILYNLFKDEFFKFNLKSKQLVKANIHFPHKKSTIQHMSWVNKKNSELYIFGGYGNYEYSGILSKVDLNESSYKEINFKGDIISPRYFSGIGQATSGHQYIFGGYGSISGKQIAHPQNNYDLFDFDENTRTTKKIATWETTDESYIVSRNIIVDTLKHQFLALTYDNHVHKNILKLKLFDIESLSVKTIANTIPFEFNDTQTTVQLKYDKEYQRLYAIILNRKGKKTELNLFALDVTGNTYSNIIEKEVVTAENDQIDWIYYLIGAFVLVISFILIKLFVSRNTKTNEVPVQDKPQEVKKPEEKVIQESIPAVTEELEEVEAEDFMEDNKMTSVINFFGGFRIIDQNGKDISNKFTPLIKQIFLLISLSQFHNGRGVTVEQMTDVFWNDMPLKKARNNRSVNIAKLKQLFKLIGNIKLVKTGDFWNLEFDQTVTFPLFELKVLLEKDQSIENLKEITKILKNGKLLYGTDYSWIEEMMAQITNGIIEKLYNYLTSETLSLTVKDKLKISDLILKYDALNEEAIHIKCQIYTSQGMHSMAKDTFEKFEQEYSLLYNEKFDLDYNEFLKSDLTSNQI